MAALSAVWAEIPQQVCADCGGGAAFELFDGAAIRPFCGSCYARRITAPAPAFLLEGGWLVGHCLRTNVGWFSNKYQRYEVYPRGCVRGCGAQTIVLAVDHMACRDNELTKSDDANENRPIEEFLRFENVLAMTTRADLPLLLGEDSYGLFVAARVPRNGAIRGGKLLIHQAVESGRIRHLSIHKRRTATSAFFHRGQPGERHSRVELVEVSLLLPPETPASPGTWVLSANDDAMRQLYDILRTTHTEAHAS
jgi:hypothetical protein